MCLEAEQWNINTSENIDVSTKNGYIHYEEKAESFLFSDIPAMEKSSADKTHLGSLGGRPETGATPVFHRRQEWLQLMRIFLFKHWDKNWKSVLLGSSYFELYNACKWSPLLLTLGI